MRKKSEFPKIPVTVRLKPQTLEKVEKLSRNKQEDRSEFLRKLIENVMEAY